MLRRDVARQQYQRQQQRVLQLEKQKREIARKAALRKKAKLRVQELKRKLAVRTPKPTPKRRTVPQPLKPKMQPIKKSIDEDRKEFTPKPFKPKPTPKPSSRPRPKTKPRLRTPELAKTKPESMPRLKTISGVPYNSRTDHKTKVAAKAVATTARKKGYNARVVPDTSQSRYRWSVYKKKKEEEVRKW